MTGEDEHGDDHEGVAGHGGRRHLLKAAGAVLAGVLVLCASGAGWAYRHLDHNIKSVDIDSALGDDRPAGASAGTHPFFAPS
ncbi:hypothetical protein [Streptomyces sp. 142MFCol3.1]|uniref:hypothetical protein n=1 Tax=Streptomyces sp. 142MFCol3.1 TaxID=1172179 RepID=UPI000400E429|nr:hypothetical protein [Streptomyces sp. 142MFCol3.1]